MKREIKFRGFNTKNNKWLYGDLIHNRGLTFICPVGIADPFATWKDFVVESESVGPFTGLYDCEGKEIYEGDLLEVANHKRDKECIADVIFLDGAFWLHFLNEDLLSIKEVSECWVVIGNIHDNPELTERKVKTIIE